MTTPTPAFSALSRAMKPPARASAAHEPQTHGAPLSPATRQHEPFDDIPHDPARDRRQFHARQARAAHKALLAMQEAEWNAVGDNAKEGLDVKN
jgi:hypothetical protein